MKRFLLTFIVIVIITGLNYSQSHDYSKLHTKNQHTLSIKKLPKSLYAIKNQILFNQIFNNQSPAPQPVPPPRWRPTFWSLFSVAWGGVGIYMATQSNKDTDKIMYSVLGAGFIIYGLIGSIDWD